MNYLLFNPLADSGKCIDKVKAFKEKYDGELRDITTLDVRELIKGLDESDEIFVLGGDGTLNRFCNDVYGLDIKQKIYACPVGTGNDFFNDVKDGPYAERDRVLMNEYIKRLPKVTVNGVERRFINGIGYGLDGMCCQVADDKKAKGVKKINYTAIALRLCLIDYKPMSAKVIVDGVEKHYDNVWILPSMKGRFYGGGMMIAPSQDRLSADGKVSVVVFYSKSRLKLLANFSKVFTGKHVTLTKMIEILTGNEVYVEYEKPTALQVDGETVRNVAFYKVSTND